MKELPTSGQLQLLSNRQQVLYALKAAKLVEHLTTLPEAKEAIATAERWLAGKATAEECKVVANAAYYTTSAVDVANSATRSAYYAVSAAFWTAQNSDVAAITATNAAIWALNAAAYTADISIYYKAKQQLIDYYEYLLTMNERVWKILEE